MRQWSIGFASSCDTIVLIDGSVGRCRHCALNADGGMSGDDARRCNARDDTVAHRTGHGAAPKARGGTDAPYDGSQRKHEALAIVRAECVISVRMACGRPHLRHRLSVDHHKVSARSGRARRAILRACAAHHRAATAQPQTRLRPIAKRASFVTTRAHVRLHRRVRTRVFGRQFGHAHHY